MAKNNKLPVDEWPEEGTPEYEEWMAQQSKEVATTGAGRDIELRLSGSDSPLVLNTESLRELTMADLAGLGNAIDATEAIGSDQYGPILQDKDKLVGVPFVALHWQFQEKGKFGVFVTMLVLTENNERYIVNDGSTGIRDQLQKITDDTGVDSMMVCKHGLRVSVYDRDLPNGQTVKDAKTYYIDTKL